MIGNDGSLTFNRSTSSEVCAGFDTEAKRFFANCDDELCGFLYGLPDIVGLTVTCDTAIRRNNDGGEVQERRDNEQRH